jgi:regulator of sirC expression with transglutaminase-like and TPR domain
MREDCCAAGAELRIMLRLGVECPGHFVLRVAQRLLLQSQLFALSEAETLSFLAEEKIDDGEEGVENYWKMHLYLA